MLFYLTVVLSRSFYIRQHKTDFYISIKTKAGSSPGLIGIENADLFNIERSKVNYDEVEIRVKDNPNQVFDIAGSNVKLIYYPYHGGKNQKFKIVPLNYEGVYNITNKNKCITYMAHSNTFELTQCSENLDEQMFEVIDHEKAAAGIIDMGNASSVVSGAMPVLPTGGALGATNAILQNIYDMIADTRSAVYALGVELTAKENGMSYHDNHGMMLPPKKVKETLLGMASLCRNFQ